MHTNRSPQSDVLYKSAWVDWPASTRRFTHRWKSKSQAPRGCIAIVHGLGEHAGRYSSLASHFVDCGLEVCSFDQQGHGKDTAARGVVSSYDHLLDEVGYLLDWSTRQLPGQPCFLFGHSMGGNLAINYVLRRLQLPLAVIASGPMFQTRKEPKGPMNAVARIAARLAPNHCISTGIKTQWLTDNLDQQELVHCDPLYHRRVSLRLGAALIDSGRWAIENAARLSVPTLITHGTLDRLTMPEGSVEFASRAGAQCRMELLQGHQHEAFRDLEGHKVVELWTNFLEAQFAG